MEKIQQLNDNVTIDTTKAETENTQNTAEINNNNPKTNTGHRIENGYVLVLL